jgi:hypothetical protein
MLALVNFYGLLSIIMDGYLHLTTLQTIIILPILPHTTPPAQTTPYSILSFQFYGSTQSAN